MAPPDNPPSDTTEDFEPPPDDDAAITNPKEVSWSTTPKENEQETIEKRKSPVRHKILPHMSVKKVLQETHAMFLATDPTFLIVSKADPAIVIQNTTDLEKNSTDDMKRFFPGTLVKQKTCIALFTVTPTDRSIV